MNKFLAIIARTTSALTDIALFLITLAFAVFIAVLLIEISALGAISVLTYIMQVFPQ